MAWKGIGKEGLAFLGSVLLQVFSILTNPQNGLETKFLVAILYLALIPVLMYSPGGKKK